MNIWTSNVKLILSRTLNLSPDGDKLGAVQKLHDRMNRNFMQTYLKLWGMICGKISVHYHSQFFK